MKKEIKEIVEVLEAYDEIKKAYEAIKPRALELLQSGETLPGYELKTTGHTSQWSEKITSKKIYTALKKWIATEDDVKVLASPSVIKKYIKEYPEALVKFDKLVIKKDKAPSISRVK